MQEKKWQYLEKNLQKKIWTVIKIDIQCWDHESNPGSVVHSAEEVLLRDQLLRQETTSLDPSGAGQLYKHKLCTERRKLNNNEPYLDYKK